MKTKMKKVIVKCIDCGHEDEIIGGQIPEGEQPMCQKCGMVMIPIKALRDN